VRRWLRSDLALEAREHETVLAHEDLAHLLDPDAWRRLGLNLTKDLRTPAGYWNVAADRYVGIARIGHGTSARSLRIRPKLDADIFFLADYAFGSERDLLAEDALRADLAVLRDDPAACFLAWFLAETQAFIDRWLRRDYILRHEVFESRVRGRLLIGEYAGRFVASGQAHRAPCQFFDLTPDNLPNQILKAALRHVGRLGARLPLPEARLVIRRRVAHQLPLLAGVGDRTVIPSDYRRLRLRGSLRHYGPIIEKARAMLDGTFISENLGLSDRDAFMWDMSVLYEQALRGVIAAWAEGTLRASHGRVQIVDSGGVRVSTSAVRPDYVIATPEGTLVLDAKYKETRIADPVNEAVAAELRVGASRIRVRQSDVYQAISYGQHHRYRPATVGLVYPVVLRPNEQLPAAYRVKGFHEEVLVLFLDVGPNARARLQEFYARLREAAGLDDIAS
jgi:5-methylcytosine-specific restriction enzyme subunit McrC